MKPLTINILKSTVADESGFSLIDLLAAVSILAIIIVAFNLHAIMAFTTFGKLTREAITFELARDKIEQLGALDPAKLDDSYDSLEMGLETEGMQFSRQVDVTVGPDKLRFIKVTVKAMTSTIPAETILERTLAPRESA